MPPEKIAEVRAWFRKAEQDLAAATLDLGARPPLLEDAVFHCQQAAEKAIKGFLVWHDIPFRKSHDLRPIGEAAVEVDPSLKEIIQRALPLTPFAGAFRYPATLTGPTLAEANDALEVAREACDALLSRLPQEVNP